MYNLSPSSSSSFSSSSSLSSSSSYSSTRHRSSAQFLTDFFGVTTRRGDKGRGEPGMSSSRGAELGISRAWRQSRRRIKQDVCVLWRLLPPRCHDPRGSEVRKSGLVTGSVWMLVFDLRRLHYVKHPFQCKAATTDILIINSSVDSSISRPCISRFSWHGECDTAGENCCIMSPEQGGSGSGFLSQAPERWQALICTL